MNYKRKIKIKISTKLKYKWAFTADIMLA